MPEHKLCTGDLGTVVEVYEPDGLEVEFVKASGETLAIVTLSEDKVRAVESADIVSVRSLSSLNSSLPFHNHQYIHVLLYNAKRLFRWN